MEAQEASWDEAGAGWHATTAPDVDVRRLGELLRPLDISGDHVVDPTGRLTEIGRVPDVYGSVARSTTIGLNPIGQGNASETDATFTVYAATTTGDGLTDVPSWGDRLRLDGIGSTLVATTTKVATTRLGNTAISMTAIGYGDRQRVLSRSEMQATVLSVPHEEPVPISGTGSEIRDRVPE